MTVHGVEWYRIFFSELTGSISVEDRTRWHSALSKAKLHNVLCFSKYWSPLLQGFLYASSVTWPSVYSRNPETVSSINAYLFIYFKKHNLWFDFSPVTSQINFQVPVSSENNWRLANMPMALPFLFLTPVTQLTHTTRTSIVLMTSPRAARTIHSYHSQTDGHRGPHSQGMGRAKPL